MGSAGSRSTRQRAVVPSSGGGIRRSSCHAPATDQRSDALSPADCPGGSVVGVAYGGSGKPCRAGDEGTVGDPVPVTSCSVPISDPVPATIAAVNDSVPATTVRVVVDLLCHQPLASLQPPISHPTLHPASPFFSPSIWCLGVFQESGFIQLVLGW